MTLQPHREILEFWRTVARFSFRDGAYIFGGPAQSNSVSDARQLLCLLWPATQEPRYRIDVPDATSEEALEPLQIIGDRHSAPLRLIRAQTAYMTRYADVEGRPTFEAGEEGVEVVESFAIGIQMSLAAIGFGRVFRSEVSDDSATAEAERLEKLASVRLSVAMIGLLRSFAVTLFDDESPSGTALHRLIEQEHRDLRAVLGEYRSEIAELRARLLEDVTVGSVAPPGSGDRSYVSCGWAWGPIAGAPQIETSASGIRQAEGLAAPVADPYFTWLVLDVVRELTSTRTRLLGLLDPEQARLAQALQLRMELARFYWSRLATFGDHRWPLERLPWPSDHADYTSVVIAGILVHNLAASFGNTDLGFAYLLRILGRLAARQEIVRPPHTDGSPPVAAPDDHRIELSFADPGRTGSHRGPDFTAVLFDVLLNAAATTNSEQLRREFTDLAGLVWDHLPDGASTTDWRNAHRLVCGLVTATYVTGGETGRSGPPLGFVHQLLADADAAFDQVAEGDRTELAARLDRARRIIDQHPARAAALLYQVLGVLDEHLQ
ncbi:SCO2524 family protein [Actinoplanes sp. NPDC026619]|uniref:SCO2524 family protein n=1 Tax=Actinoplanes sp. NPDC026619 TaxID=3155798 RepID=UPI0034046C8E